MRLLKNMARRSRPNEILHYKTDGPSIPVWVFYEHRRNVRVASGQKAVMLRIPKMCPSVEREKHKSWGLSWVQSQWRENARFRAQYWPVQFENGMRIRTYDRMFILHLSDIDAKRMSGRISQEQIRVRVPRHWTPEMRAETLEKMIHKALALRYTPVYEQRIIALHAGKFSKPVESVKMKLLSSKWGSCSSDGRLIFSTRLLFAPPPVQDYVIIHELCHLDVLNHSKAFWSLVASHDPGYKEKERWLNEKGHLCDLAFVVREGVE